LESNWADGLLSVEPRTAKVARADAVELGRNLGTSTMPFFSW
jgi:hypothetical protein